MSDLTRWLLPQRIRAARQRRAYERREQERRERRQRELEERLRLNPDGCPECGHYSHRGPCGAEFGSFLGSYPCTCYGDPRLRRR